MNNPSEVPLIFEMSSPGRRGYEYPDCDVPSEKVTDLIPSRFLRKKAADLPELSESEVVRHFTQLSRLNYGVDVGFYPLGSCTMKYNPKINEDVAKFAGFQRIHPYQGEETVQGALKLMYELEKYLCEIAGLYRATMQPAAGAHGELTGLMIIKAFHRDRGENHKRQEIIVPDSAHGTNPASAAMCGYRVVEVKSNPRGGVDVLNLRKITGPQTAGLMLTNPNTLGLFEEDIVEIAHIVHQAGGLLYYDGANMNANLGISRPGDMGFDIVHYNLHKTFAAPHGGGGPGSGPIAVTEELEDFLPVPLVSMKDNSYYLDYDRPKSIGKVKSFYGNFLVMVKAYAYIRSLGAQGLREVSEIAVLNANYLMRQLQKDYHLPFDRSCKHEFVLSAKKQKAKGVRALDIAKRLLDYGFHPPTIYFPLVVEEALMVEPTETESKETLDRFGEAMREIALEAMENPEILKEAPHHTPLRRLDEVKAVKELDVNWYKRNPSSAM